jgi:hypothetical protein
MDLCLLYLAEAEGISFALTLRHRHFDRLWGGPYFVKLVLIRTTRNQYWQSGCHSYVFEKMGEKRQPMSRNLETLRDPESNQEILSKPSSSENPLPWVSDEIAQHVSPCSARELHRMGMFGTFGVAPEECGYVARKSGALRRLSFSKLLRISPEFTNGHVEIVAHCRHYVATNVGSAAFYPAEIKRTVTQCFG